MRRSARTFHPSNSIETKFPRLLVGAAVFAVMGSASARAGWNRLPYAETRPVDVATKAIPGTKLVSSSGLGNAAALLSSGINETITLAAGKSSAVIMLGNQQNIHTVTFNNDGAEGKVTVAGSIGNKDWTALGTGEFSHGDRIAQVHFATATVKYVSLTFESEKGGTIRSFEIYGDSTDKDFKLLPNSLSEGGTSVNFASGAGGARPIYAFPTPTNVGEVGVMHNVFKFPKSRDKYRTIVYDLGSSRTMKMFATSYSQRPVRIEVFAFDELPEKKDWRGKLTLDPAVFDTIKPVAVGEDPKGVGHIKITPGKPVSARYIALRFEPNYQRNSAVGFFEVGTQDVIAAAANAKTSEEAGEFAALPGLRFVQDDDDTFTIGGVEFASANGYQQSPTGGNDGESDGDGTGHGNGNGNQNHENNNYTGVGIPYVAGMPSTPAATLPQNFGTGTTTSTAASGGKSTKGTRKAGSVAPHSP